MVVNRMTVLAGKLCWRLLTKENPADCPLAQVSGKALGSLRFRGQHGWTLLSLAFSSLRFLSLSAGWPVHHVLEAQPPAPLAHQHSYRDLLRAAALSPQSQVTPSQPDRHPNKIIRLIQHMFSFFNFFNWLELAALSRYANSTQWIVDSISLPLPT